MPIVGKLAKAEAKQARNYIGLGAVHTQSVCSFGLALHLLYSPLSK